VLTPPPRNMLRQGTSNQRTRHNPYTYFSEPPQLLLSAENSPICAVPIKMPVYNGLFSLSTLVETMLNAPFTIPLTPSPATALPTINTVLFGATPHIKLPSSKTNTKTR
jgi:hypothetical protein